MALGENGKECFAPPSVQFTTFWSRPAVAEHFPTLTESELGQGSHPLLSGLAAPQRAPDDGLTRARLIHPLLAPGFPPHSA